MIKIITPAEITKQQQSLVVKLAVQTGEIEQAMRLRYKVFVKEAENSHLYNESGIESDNFDEYCDHLIVKDLECDEVVGTYRLLQGINAIRHRGFYSETEFDLTAFQEKKPYALELGRSCIAPEYRDGKVIQLLWEGIAKYITEYNHKYMIGCVSLTLKNIKEINEIYSLLRMKRIINDSYGIHPLLTHRINGLQMVEMELNDKEIFRKLPPLMRGYQWLGADIGGEPACDIIFNTTDFFIILETGCVAKRYQRRFLNGNKN